MASNTRTFTVEILDTRKGSGMRDAAAEASDLSTKLDKAGASADGLSTDMRKADRAAGGYASGLDSVGESADTGEARILGVKDTVDGVATIMQGPGEQGIAAYIQGWADLSSGIANAVVPALKTAKTMLIDNARQAITSGLSHARAAAMTALGWVKMGLQATINAAKMAAAWLISLGPIGLVIAAVAAVIAILVALGVGFDDIKRWAQIAWDFILGAIKAVWNWISENWPLLLAILTGPIGIAVLTIVKHWDTIKKGISAVKDWIKGRIDDVVGFFTSIPGRIAGMITSMGAKGAELGSAFLSGVKNAITGAWGFASDVASAIVSAVKSAWNSFAGTINGLIPNSIGWGPARIDLPNNPIPTFARGGVAPGGIALVGEEGPELVDLPAGSRVFPHGQSMGMLGGSVVIDMRGAIVADDRQFEEMVVRAFRSAAGKGVPLNLRGRMI